MIDNQFNQLGPKRKPSQTVLGTFELMQRALTAYRNGDDYDPTNPSTAFLAGYYAGFREGVIVAKEELWPEK